ncbi:hypothetical protein BKA57DRAFT_172911 [Linnemannia elongata]|nr:hypothetical protein BKA57DRAFT_172911 [Linnemannia elongata]
MMMRKDKLVKWVVFFSFVFLHLLPCRRHKQKKKNESRDQGIRVMWTWGGSVSKTTETTTFESTRMASHIGSPAEEDSILSFLTSPFPCLTSNNYCLPPPPQQLLNNAYQTRAWSFIIHHPSFSRSLPLQARKESQEGQKDSCSRPSHSRSLGTIETFGVPGAPANSALSSSISS